tara:strand:- start:1281 stop:2990 length:1710 start_codon:yes stop_codon:yes gene_type:complete
MKLFLNIKNNLNTKYLSLLSILVIFLLLLSILETIGLSSIPILISSIIKESLFIENLNFKYLNYFYEELNQKEQIYYISLFIISFFLFKNLYHAFVFYFQGKLVKSIKIFISNKLFKYYINQNYSFLFEKNSSKIIRTLSTDVGNATIYLLNLLNLFRDIFILIAVLSLLVISNPTITISLFFILSIVVFSIYRLNRSKIFKRGKIIQFLSSEIIKIINETIGLFKEIKVYNISDYQKKNFLQRITRAEKNIFYNYLITSLPRLILEVVSVSIIILIILYFLRYETSILTVLPFLSLIVLAIIRLVPIFSGISSSLTTLKSIQPSFQLVMEELQKEKDSRNNEDLHNLNFKNKIILNNVSFSYPGYEDNKIIKNLNIEIKSGDKIGIIGSSGSGKSTFINLIMGFLKPTGGQILIDDVDTSSLKYRIRNLGFVPQEIFLLEDSVIKNIALGIDDKEIDLEKIKSVSMSAQIYDNIDQLKEKFNTVVNERGINFSVGQKQRLGVARALYRDSNILILDESTSSLDENTEKKFVEDIFSISNDQTIIFISHRMSALKKCSKIFDVEKNKFI